MSSMFCRPDQQAVDQQPPFRTKLRIKTIKVTVHSRYGGPIRNLHVPFPVAKHYVRRLPQSDIARALHSLGVRP